MEMLALFAREFKGRKVAYETLAPDTVELGAADAMEFLYTYVWGPESFPYEVREQYGVLPYREYRERIVGWLQPIAPPTVIELDPGDRSYLQPGYARRLAELVRHTDVDGHDVRLPDSNALWVFEKRHPGPGVE